MQVDPPAIVERDGDVVRIVTGPIEVIARLTRVDDTITLEKMSIDGAGPGSAGLRVLRELAREFLRRQGAKRLVVRGTTRTTGASPGKAPREVVIVV